MTSRRPASKGFTLIELLIVVSIISILAAIAVPNFLQAQVRAKVARTRSDMRTIATALETYAVDRNGYPPMLRTGGEEGGGTVWFFVPNQLTTPVGYITNKGLLIDPFKPHRVNTSFGQNPDGRARDYYNYINAVQINQYSFGNFHTYPPREQYAGAWELWSYGPDIVAGPSYNGPFGITFYLQYDPTNGAVSPGDIRRTQRDTLGVMKGGQ